MIGRQIVMRVISFIVLILSIANVVVIADDDTSVTTPTNTTITTDGNTTPNSGTTNDALSSNFLCQRDAECDLNNVQAGSCQRGDDESTFCLCNPGFMGDYCSVPCLECMNGGYCGYDAAGSVVCICPDGFQGLYCDNSNYQYGNPSTQTFNDPYHNQDMENNMEDSYNDDYYNDENNLTGGAIAGIVIASLCCCGVGMIGFFCGRRSVLIRRENKKMNQENMTDNYNDKTYVDAMIADVTLHNDEDDKDEVHDSRKPKNSNDFMDHVKADELARGQEII